MAVFVKALLCDEDSLGFGREDWRIVRCNPIENRVESGIVSCLLGNKLVCHRFTDAGRGHTIPGSETKGSSLVTAMAVTRVSAFPPVPEPISIG